MAIFRKILKESKYYLKLITEVRSTIFLVHIWQNDGFKCLWKNVQKKKLSSNNKEETEFWKLYIVLFEDCNEMHYKTSWIGQIGYVT